MASFDSKKITVEAMQYKDDPAEAEKFIDDKLESSHQMPGDKGVVIGDHACIAGDWIVKRGEKFMVMSDKAFKAMFGEGD
jgi:hypothetical protein